MYAMQLQDAILRQMRRTASSGEVKDSFETGIAVSEKADCQTAFLTATCFCFTLDAVLVLAAISHRLVERITDCFLLWMMD